MFFFCRGKEVRSEDFFMKHTRIRNLQKQARQSAKNEILKIKKPIERSEQAILKLKAHMEKG